MRIIRWFRDYYDGVSHYDSGGNIWRRKSFWFRLPEIAAGEKRIDAVEKQLKSVYDQETLPLKLSEEQQLFLVNAFNESPTPEDYVVVNPPKDNKWWARTIVTPLKRGVLGYCGKLYYLVIDDDKKELKSFKSFEEALEKIKDAERPGRFSKSFSSLFHKKLGLQEWEQKYQNHPALANIFFALKSPIFIICVKPEKEHTAYRSAEVVVNPRLSYYGLQRIFPPAVAHQDIDYFIGNFLTNIQDVGFERTDELIRDSKGFDDWSFRKMGKNSIVKKR